MLEVTKLLTAVAKVYDQEKQQFLTARFQPQTINYLVGKIMVETKGQADAPLAMKFVKAITEADSLFE